MALGDGIESSMVPRNCKIEPASLSGSGLQSLDSAMSPLRGSRLEALDDARDRVGQGKHDTALCHTWMAKIGSVCY